MAIGPQIYREAQSFGGGRLWKSRNSRLKDSLPAAIGCEKQPVVVLLEKLQPTSVDYTGAWRIPSVLASIRICVRSRTRSLEIWRTVEYQGFVCAYEDGRSAVYPVNLTADLARSALATGRIALLALNVDHAIAIGFSAALHPPGAGQNGPRHPLPLKAARLNNLGIEALLEDGTIDPAHSSHRTASDHTAATRSYS